MPNVLILVDEDLLALVGTRTEDGDRITAELGEPVDTAHFVDEAREPAFVYEPTFTRHADPTWHPLRSIAESVHAIAGFMAPTVKVRALDPLELEDLPTIPPHYATEENVADAIAIALVAGARGRPRVLQLPPELEIGDTFVVDSYTASDEGATVSLRRVPRIDPIADGQMGAFEASARDG